LVFLYFYYIRYLINKRYIYLLINSNTPTYYQLCPSHSHLYHLKYIYSYILHNYFYIKLLLFLILFHHSNNCILSVLFTHIHLTYSCIILFYTSIILRIIFPFFKSLWTHKSIYHCIIIFK
jgi:hypothetical protein